jgi:hypothetical protein
LPRRFAATLVVALLVAAMQAGCGSSEPAAVAPTVRAAAPPASSPTDPRGQARAALLRLSWVGEPWEVERRAPPVRCPAIDPWRGATVKLSSPLLRQETVAVQQTIAVLPTPALAREVSRRLASPPAQECFERALKAEIHHRQGISNYGPMVLVRDEAHGRRSTISSQMEYGEILTTVDEIRTPAGRLIADTVVISGPDVIRESLYRSLLSLVTRRLRDATGKAA